MALFTATSSFTLPASDNDFSDWLDASVTLSLLDNVGFTSLTGRTYDDALRITWDDDANFRTQWLGTGLVFDPNTGSLTDGTITGFVEEKFVGGVWVQQWASENYSIDAVTLSNAGRSASTADDDQIVATVLSGADTYNLSSEADSAYGYAGNDSMYGNGGNDTLHGDAGNDSLDGGAGSDRLFGDAGNDTLRGGFDSDTLDGGGGADSISGDAGDDTVIARAGSATLAGGTQWDTLSYEFAGAAVSVDLATGRVTGAFGNQRVSGFEVLVGSSFDDTLIGDTAVTEFHPGAGSDTIDGGGMLSDPQGAGVEAVVYLDAPSAVVVDLGLGKATGGSGTDTLVRINGVFGSEFNDTLRGGSGDEGFAGAGGNDSIDGGAGFDIIAAGFHGAVAIDLGARTVTGADGSDRFTRIEGAFGGDFNDTLTGSTGNDSLDGGDGNDTLFGLTGNDTLEGSVGNDSLDGGPGIDTVSYAEVWDSVTVNLALTGLQNTVGGGFDSLVGFENLVGGSYDDRLIGSASSNRMDGGPGADTLRGGAGNDTLDGGSGFDSLVGGTGNDTYVVSGTGDTISETSTLASETDTVRSSVSWTLGANLERLTLTGTAASGTGNTLANLITGNASANTLGGGGGNDRLVGAGGKDTLNGGSGNDTLAGGAGNDSLNGGTGRDVFHFDAALSAAGNVDRISGFVSTVDTVQLENAVFTALSSTGALATGAFRAGAAAADAGDRIIYNGATGQLFYDADGTGAAAQILFATFATGTALAATDFFVT